MSDFPATKQQRSLPYSSSEGVGSPLDELIRRTLSRPKTLVLAAIVSAAVAAGAAYQLSHDRYQYEGKLLHATNSITTPYYQSPNLGSLVQLVVSPKLLQQVRSDCQIADDLATLRANIGFDVAQNDTLTVTLTRRDPAEAERVLNRLMTRFVEVAAELRNSALNHYVESFTKDATSADFAYDQARKNQQEFIASNQLEALGELKNGNSMLEQIISDVELSLESACSELLSAQAKRAHFADVSPETGTRVVAKKVVMETTSNPSSEADNKSVPASFENGDSNTSTAASASNAAPVRTTRASDLERRNLLKDRIRQQQESASYAVRVKVLKDELARARKLREKQLISGAEVDKLVGELSILEAEQSANSKLLVDELATVEGRIDHSMKHGDVDPLLGVSLSDSQVDPAFSPLQVIAALDLEILGLSERIKYFEMMLAEKKVEFSRVASLQKQLIPLGEEVRSAGDERDRLHRLVKEFRQASNAGTELTIVQPASLAFGGVRSNQSKIFGASFAAVMVLLVAPLIVADWRRINAGK